MLVRITSDDFCAGVIIENDHVVETAPILKFTLGWHRSRFVTYFRCRYCEVEPVW
jgi:hypothetical protein